MKSDSKINWSMGRVRIGIGNLLLLLISICALVVMSFPSSSQAKKGGSSGWKDWNEWGWEQPTFEELSENFHTMKTWGFKLEFISVWDERFQNHPNAADGFLVFHVGTLFDVDIIGIELVPPEGMNVLASLETEIEFLEVGVVKSVFVPVKAPGNTGEFLFHVTVTNNHLGEQIDDSIVIVKKHRRDIYGQSVHENVLAKREERLSGIQKRPGADYYRPSDYCEPAAIVPEGATIINVPSMTGFSDYLESREIPDEQSEECADHPEFFMDVDRSEAHTSTYTLSGKIVYMVSWLPRIYEPLVGARVWILDADSGPGNIIIDEQHGDQFICEAYTNEDGEFSCTGEADDDSGFPDPYVAVFPINFDVQVIECFSDPDLRLGATILHAGMWRDATGMHGHADLPDGTYELSFDYSVSEFMPMDAQFFTFAQVNKALWANISAWTEAVGPLPQGHGKINACAYTENLRQSHYAIYELCYYTADGQPIDCGYFPTIHVHPNDSFSASVVMHNFGHAMHHILIGYEYDHDLPGIPYASRSPQPAPWDYNQEPDLAFSEGFANAQTFLVNDFINEFSTVTPPYFCTGTALPWTPKDPCGARGGPCCGEGYEGSKAHYAYDNVGGTYEWYYDEMIARIAGGTPIGDFPYGWVKGPNYTEFNEARWRGIRTALCEKYPVGHELHDDYCPVDADYQWEREYLITTSEKARKGASETLVTSALWDLYDSWGGEDDSCYFHFWARWAQVCDAAYLPRNLLAFGTALEMIQGDPQNYYEYIEDFGEEYAADCEHRNYIRTFSRFNGITLRGIFDWPLSWESCDKFPPEEQPCAATQVVVDTVEDGVEGETLTQEEGESLLEKIRRIRDEYLLKSDRGLMYAEMYSTCSYEIVQGIIGDPQMTLIALELMQDAAQKIENLEQYMSNGETPIDDNFLFLATTILEELKSHTSDDLLSSIEIIEGDLGVVQGMTVEEILEYFEWSP